VVVTTEERLTAAQSVVTDGRSEGTDDALKAHILACVGVARLEEYGTKVSHAPVREQGQLHITFVVGGKKGLQQYIDT